jgi:hypothetical protein
LLRQLARRPSTFNKYSGHLLLAFYFIATTSRDAELRRVALAAGRERARHWRQRWYRKRRKLDATTVVDEIYASHAAEQLGVAHRKIRRDLETAAARCAPRELLGFDPLSRRIPRANRYAAWYDALIRIYFCERWGLRLPVAYSDVMALLPQLQPYPGPRSRHYRDAIYAVTHIVYTLNDYNRWRLRARRMRRERAFLKAGMSWAIARSEADTVGEIVDSLAGCGVADTDPVMTRGRAFILAQQRPDGGWGDENDAYGRFHSVWTCIDGLRDYSWPGSV